MGFLINKITGNGTAQVAVTNDATLEAVVNSLVAYNSTGGVLTFSVLVDGSTIFTESVSANSSYRIPDKINLSASKVLSVNAATGVSVTVSYLQQAIDVAGALNAAQTIASNAEINLNGIVSTANTTFNTYLTAASNAAAAAQTAYDSFDDRYLGSKAVSPVLDNDGSPLLGGALYYNTANAQMYVYDSANIVWISLGFVPTDHTSLTNIGTRTHAQLESDIAGKLPLAGGTMTGAITSLRETKVAMAAANINLALGNLFTKTISGATTLTVSNVPTTGNVGYMILELTNAGSAAITWFSGVKWAGGTAPTLTASGKDIISMYTHDGGTVWNVSGLMKDVK